MEEHLPEEENIFHVHAHGESGPAELAKAIAGGWIDELNAVKTLSPLPPTWTTGTIYAAGAWASVHGSGLTSAAPEATSILSVIPTGLSWTAKVGASNLAPAIVSITNAGTGSLTFAGVSDQLW